MRLIYQEITTKSILYPKCVKLRHEFLWKPYRIITPNYFDSEENKSIILVTQHHQNIIGCILLTPELQYH